MHQLQPNSSSFKIETRVDHHNFHTLPLDADRGLVYMVIQNPHAPSKQCIFPLVQGQNSISFTTLDDQYPGNPSAGEHNCVSFSLLDDSDLDVPQSYAMNKEKTYVFDATIKLFSCAQKKTYDGAAK